MYKVKHGLLPDRVSDLFDSKGSTHLLHRVLFTHDEVNTRSDISDLL